MFKEQKVVKTLWTEVFISPLKEKEMFCISAHKHRLHSSWGRVKNDRGGRRGETCGVKHESIQTSGLEITESSGSSHRMKN